MWAMSGEFAEADQSSGDQSSSGGPLEQQLKELAQRMTAIEGKLKKVEG